jgi:hypothetical protein
MEAAYARVSDDPFLVLPAPLSQVFVDGLPLAQVRIDQPVNKLVNLSLDTLGHISYHHLLKLTLDPVLTEQVKNTCQAESLVKVFIPAFFHLEQDIFNI